MEMDDETKKPRRFESGGVFTYPVFDRGDNGGWRLLLRRD
jgi:hypothetical protein